MRSKYGGKKTIVDGIKFDSKKEAKRYQELKLLERASEICDLRLQVKYELIPEQCEPPTEFYRIGTKKGLPKKGKVAEKKCEYRADFVYVNKKGETVVEDVKGFRTKDYIIKRKLMLYRYGIRIKEV